MRDSLSGEWGAVAADLPVGAGKSTELVENSGALAIA